MKWGTCQRPLSLGSWHAASFTWGCRAFLSWWMWQLGHLMLGLRSIFFEETLFERPHGTILSQQPMSSAKRILTKSPLSRARETRSVTCWTLFIPTSHPRGTPCRSTPMAPIALKKFRFALPSSWSLTPGNPSLGQTGFPAFHCQRQKPKCHFIRPSEYGGIDLLFLVAIATVLLLAHIVGTAWLLGGVEENWQIFDDEIHSSLYCLSADAIRDGIDPHSMKVPRPASASDEPYSCLPQRFDHASPQQTHSLWPEALCALARRVALFAPGDARCN